MADKIANKTAVKTANKPKSKISEQDKIQINNLVEEVTEILEPCVKCGMCKSLCPVFKILRQEEYSPRGKSVLLSNKILDKIVFECNLCRACEVKCPLHIKVCDAMIKAREALVLRKKGLKQNEEMIANIRKTGNPFGKLSDLKQGDKLYCC
tara:strand:- start:803 stop:1258 length:456 start_codon:yes stop_codon:yes gene_type:complete